MVFSFLDCDLNGKLSTWFGRQFPFHDDYYFKKMPVFILSNAKFDF